MKKRLISILVCVFLCLLALVGYLVLQNLPQDGSKAETTAAQLVAGEVEGVNGRIQMFPHVTKDNVKSLFVHNESGDYRIIRKDKSLVIEGHEHILLDAEKLTQMIVNAGYTLSTYNAKVNAEDFSKYGLSETDAAAYFVLTTTDGKRYTVYIGDRIPSGGGYYARYEGRNAVYVLDTSIKKDLLAPVTALVRPLLAYPSQMNSYYLMHTFVLSHGEEVFLAAEYLDPEARSDLAAMSVHRITAPADYYAGDGYNSVLTLFCDFSGSSVCAIDLTPETLAKFGLDQPAYTLYAVNTAVDEQGNPKSLIENLLTFSSMQTDGEGNDFYYAASYNFGIVARVEAITLDFLSWNLEKWLSANIFQINIANVASLDVSADGLDEHFVLSGEDNEHLTVEATTAGITPKIKNFRQLWKTMLSVTLEGSVDFTGEEYATLTAEGNCILTLTATTRAGVVQEFKFYPYSDRRVFYTVGGKGGFYVNRAMVDKVIADCRRVLAGEPIDSEIRY